MPAPTGKILMKDIVLTVDATSYANQFSKAELVPDTPIQTMRTLVPDGVIQDVDSTVWRFEIAGHQIWGTAGFAKFLNDNAGEEVEIVFQQKSGAGQPKATFTALALPVSFGGQQGVLIPFEATLPVIGEPVFSTSA